MVELFGKCRKSIFLGVLVAFAIVGVRSANTLAATNAFDEGSAIVTVHVLEANADAPSSPEEPVADPAPVEYIEPSIIDDSPERVDVDEEGIDIDEEDENVDGEVKDEADDENSNANENNDGGPSNEVEHGDENSGKSVTGSLAVPNTGESTNTGVFDSEGGLLSIVVVMLSIGCMTLWIKRRKVIKNLDYDYTKRVWRNKRIENPMVFLQGRHSNVRFSGEKNGFFELLSWRRAIAIVISCSVLLLMGTFALRFEQPGDVSAAGFTYPYTISTDDGKHYDIYVRQGEFAKAGFAIRTSTDNVTGYTLSLSTEEQSLVSANNSTHIGMVDDGTSLSSFANNTWGFSTNGSTYGNLPKGHRNGKMIYQTKGASANGNSVVIYFAAKIAEDMPVGDYATTVYLDAVTNPVHRNLTFANGSVVNVTRLSDNSAITNNSQVLLGEELKITSLTDEAGIVQMATINGDVVNSGEVVTVDKDLRIGTRDDSIHFLKNDYVSPQEDDSNSSSGDAILIKSEGKYWLVDTGKSETTTGKPNGKSVADYLKKLGVDSLDYVLITHMHSDHMGGVNQLVSEGLINSKTTVYMRGCEATQSISDDGITASSERRDKCASKLNTLRAIGKANVVDFYNHESERANIQANGIDFGNFKITMYNIKKGSNGHIDYNVYRENLNSIGMKVVHKPSKKTAFLAADWEWGNEAEYGSAIGKVDILKAGHHGLKTSNSYEFIKALNPKTVFITGQNSGGKTSGKPTKQAAAWAFVEQNNGSVYFTGDSTGDAVAVSFGDSSYSVKKGKSHNILDDSNTGGNNMRQTGSTYMQWEGGVTGWGYPANKDGSGGSEAYADYTAKYYVDVYQNKSSAGNIIAHVDKCINNYTYKFKSTYGNGVAKGRTKGCN